MGFEIPWIGGSIYLTHNLKQEETWYSMGSGQNTIGRGFEITCVGGSIYHGKESQYSILA
jgi:hypothetical protein